MGKRDVETVTAQNIFAAPHPVAVNNGKLVDSVAVDQQIAQPNVAGVEPKVEVSSKASNVGDKEEKQGADKETVNKDSEIRQEPIQPLPPREESGKKDGDPPDQLTTEKSHVGKNHTNEVE